MTRGIPRRCRRAGRHRHGRHLARSWCPQRGRRTSGGPGGSRSPRQAGRRPALRGPAVIQPPEPRVAGRRARLAWPRVPALVPERRSAHPLPRQAARDRIAQHCRDGVPGCSADDLAEQEAEVSWRDSRTRVPGSHHSCAAASAAHVRSQSHKSRTVVSGGSPGRPAVCSSTCRNVTVPRRARRTPAIPPQPSGRSQARPARPGHGLQKRQPPSPWIPPRTSCRSTRQSRSADRRGR